MNLAFLAQGKLYLKLGDAEPRRVESDFAQKVQERAREIRRRHAWKQKDVEGDALSRAMLWGQTDVVAQPPPVAMLALGSGRSPGELLYTVRTDQVTGVIAYGAGADFEQRLYHQPDTWVEYVNGQPKRDSIACSVLHPDGTSNVALLEADGSGLRSITSGDSIDQAPTFEPGQKTLLYHSAGIGRDAQGLKRGRSPFSVLRLDLADGSLETIAEAPGHDHLGPRADDGGRVYFIRRPHHTPLTSSIGRAAKDFVLFPFRLLYALFQWLNLFSARNTGRYLTSSGGPKKKGPDETWLRVWGNMIKAEQTVQQVRRVATGDSAPALVPRTWQLIRVESGEQKVLARGVLAFDLCADGGIVYSNGNAVFHLDKQHQRQLLFRHPHVTQVVALGDFEITVPRADADPQDPGDDSDEARDDDSDQDPDQDDDLGEVEGDVDKS